MRQASERHAGAYQRALHDRERYRCERNRLRLAQSGPLLAGLAAANVTVPPAVRDPYANFGPGPRTSRSWATGEGATRVTIHSLGDLDGEGEIPQNPGYFPSDSYAPGSRGP